MGFFKKKRVKVGASVFTDDWTSKVFKEFQPDVIEAIGEQRVNGYELEICAYASFLPYMHMVLAGIDKRICDLYLKKSITQALDSTYRFQTLIGRFSEAFSSDIENDQLELAPELISTFMKSLELDPGQQNVMVRMALVTHHKILMDANVDFFKKLDVVL